MKHGRVQSKDIDEMPILRLLLQQPDTWHTRYDTSGWGDTMPSIVPAFPPDTHDKLVLAKMRALIKRGLVTGCSCGCRGDFTITKDGMAYYFVRVREAQAS